VIGAVVIFAWSGGLSLLLFTLLKSFHYLRISEEAEMAGLDLAKHKEPAYPSAGWEGHHPVSLSTQDLFSSTISGNTPQIT